MAAGSPIYDPNINWGIRAVTTLTAQGWALRMTVDVTNRRLPILAVCTRCTTVVSTGDAFRLDTLPLSRAGHWPCDKCVGTAIMPAAYTIVDQRNSHEVDAYEPARVAIAMSAVTAAELYRLARAARALQAGRPGAADRLQRALAEAPAPIRDLSKRWSRADKMQLAAIVISLVALLLPMLKDDGSVTPQQLIDLVEQVVGEQSGDDQQPAARNSDDGAHDARPGQHPAAVEPRRSAGKWLPDSPADDSSVQQPGE